MINSEITQQLTDIKEQMLELLDSAMELIPEGISKERAKCYWYAHIKTALLKEHEYLGGSLITMDDTIIELNVNETQEEEE